jgi:hypothetical protein
LEVVREAAHIKILLAYLVQICPVVLVAAEEVQTRTTLNLLAKEELELQDKEIMVVLLVRRMEMMLQAEEVLVAAVVVQEELEATEELARRLEDQKA